MARPFSLPARFRANSSNTPPTSASRTTNWRRQPAFFARRYRARLSARYVVKKAKQLVGFHERRSSFVADMWTCEVLPERISALLEPLRGLIASLAIRERVPQVELAIGDAVDVLVLRILDPPGADDEEKLRDFAERHRIQFFLQPKGPETAYPFHPRAVPGLQYRI